MKITDLHHIQKHILRELSYKKWARFRDLRPPRVDSNLYNYHLKLLIKGNLVEKDQKKGYRLSPDGLKLVGHVSMQTYEIRWQPKILTKLVAINQNNQIILWPKHKQPFIGRWSLPNGKMHFEDPSVELAMRREITYLSKDKPLDLKHVGVIEYQAYISENVVAHTISHIFTARIRHINHNYAQWIYLSELANLDLTPSTKETIEAVQTENGFFYKNFNIDW